MTLPLVAFSVGSTLATALRVAPLDALENRILFGHALRLSRIELITQSERVLDANEVRLLSELFRRRLDGEPIAYIVGQREFYGLVLHVTPDVLIPRPETELLVDLALERIPPAGRVLDLGTGSGAIAIAIAHQRPDASVTAVDLSPSALQIARANAKRHGVDVSFVESDWYRNLGGAKFDLVVANPPYIEAGDGHLAQGDLRFEPIGALTDHGDGFSALHAIIDGAPSHLHNDGLLLMEHGYDQALRTRRWLRAQSFRDIQSWQDLAGIERVSGARRAR